MTECDEVSVDIQPFEILNDEVTTGCEKELVNDQQSENTEEVTNMICELTNRTNNEPGVTEAWQRRKKKPKSIKTRDSDVPQKVRD